MYAIRNSCEVTVDVAAKTYRVAARFIKFRPIWSVFTLITLDTRIRDNVWETDTRTVCRF